MAEDLAGLRRFYVQAPGPSLPGAASSGATPVSAARWTSEAQRLAPFAEAVALLQTIPGVSAVAAATIVAEIGVRIDSSKIVLSPGRCLTNNVTRRRDKTARREEG